MSEIQNSKQYHLIVFNIGKFEFWNCLGFRNSYLVLYQRLIQTTLMFCQWPCQPGFIFPISLTGGTSLAHVTLFSGENDNSKESGIKVGFHSTFKTALGYNHKRFYIGFSYVNLPVISQAPVPKGWIRFGTGNIRFNIVYRFPLKKPIKILDPKYWWVVKYRNFVFSMSVIQIICKKLWQQIYYCSYIFWQG